MRTTTAGEDTVLQARQSRHYLRVRIKDSGGSWVAYDDRSGVDWQEDAEITQDANQRVAQARLRVAREADGNSLSPLINSDIDAGRAIEIAGARVAAGATPSAGDYKVLFLGVIDRWDCASDPMELIARDDSGLLYDRWVEEEREYGSEDGTDIEDVMQAILDDWTDSAFTLYTPTSPSFVVTPYVQRKEPVQSALQALADLIGWVVEYRWDNGTGAFRLTFYEPDRTPSATDWSFDADDYYDVTQLAVDRLDIRNVVTVRYTDSATGARSSYTATDASSVTAYGRQWMEIEEGEESPIDTAAEAQALADAALADLSTPLADQSIEVDLFWPLQLGDFYEFVANDVHYDLDQEFAVVGYSHRWEQGRATTTIQTRGAGAVSHTRGWLERETRPRDPDEVEAAYRLSDWRFVYDSTAGTLTIKWNRGDLVHEVWVYDRVRNEPVNDNPWPAQGTQPTSTLEIGTDSYTTTAPAAGTKRYIQFETRDAQYFARWIRRHEIDPPPIATVDDLPDDGIGVAKLKLAVDKFQLSNPNAFSATDYNTVAWAAVTMTTAGGRSYSISSGNTGDMVGGTTYYIYFDPALSTTTFQVTVDLDDTVGEDKVLLCMAKPKSNTGQSAFFLPAVGIFGGLGADQLSANLIATDILAANTITALLLNVGELSAITADLGTVTAGTIEADVIVAAETFTALVAFFEGLDVGSEADFHDLVTFSDSGAVVFDDGRIAEFYDSSNNFRGDIRGSLSETAILARGHWKFGSLSGSLVETPASTTDNAGLRLPHGSAPTSPVDGDMWTTSSGLYVRINGSTVGPLS